MRRDIFFESKGAGKIHGCVWTPEGQPKAVVQFVHGIAEHVERYDHYANFLNQQGILVVAEDHMGHGKSAQTGTKGYFDGGWDLVVEDTYQLMKDTMAQYPGIPYVLYGHSMGSFIARTILIRYPDSGIDAAVICGTGWIPEAVVKAGVGMAGMICKVIGERTPSQKFQDMIFGSYNKKIEHPRTGFDWLTRDERIVDAYIADPMCGFTVCCGLLRDMMKGISIIEKNENLQRMNRGIPTLFVAGAEDPVGNFGQGVTFSAEKFKAIGVQDVTVKLFPMCRHEIHNEINRDEVYGYILNWISEKVLK